MYNATFTQAFVNMAAGLAPELVDFGESAYIICRALGSNKEPKRGEKCSCGMQNWLCVAAGDPSVPQELFAQRLYHVHVIILSARWSKRLSKNIIKFTSIPEHGLNALSLAMTILIKPILITPTLIRYGMVLMRLRPRSIAHTIEMSCLYPTSFRWATCEKNHRSV